MTFKLLDQLLLFRFAFFSLPWLLVSYFLLASSYETDPKGVLFWVLVGVAFLGGRSLGMSINRLVDQEFDLKNERTSNRPLPSGKISEGMAFLVALLSLALFVGSLLWLGFDVLLLSLPPLILILSYSWTKRWTPFCHFWLGSIYFFIPPLLSLAFFGAAYGPSWLLGGAFALFITSGDLLYALQDVEFDQNEGLKSFPAVYGVDRTLDLARVLVLLALTFLLILHLYLGTLLLGLLWGRFLWSPKIKESAYANRAFQTCNLLGGFILLITFLV